MRSSPSACAWGRVTHDDDGSGIADAVVLLSRKDIISGQAPVPGERTLPVSTITYATGGWQLDAVDPGRCRVSAPRSASSPRPTRSAIAGRSEQTGINLAVISGGASTVPPIFGRCPAMSTNSSRRPYGPGASTGTLASLAVEIAS
jgi:hypothetical protein